MPVRLSPTGRTQVPAALLLVVSCRGQTGVKTQTVYWRHGAAIPMISGLRGRWDRNRTCSLRFWSLLPFVQTRPRLSKAVQGCPSTSTRYVFSFVVRMAYTPASRQASHELTYADFPQQLQVVCQSRHGLQHGGPHDRVESSCIGADDRSLSSGSHSLPESDSSSQRGKR
jgi:hypothetical protein